MNEDKLNLRGIRDWLKTKKPGDTYNWYSYNNCMIAQYIKSLGLRPYDMDQVGLYHYDKVREGYPIAAEEPWTFGAALKRVEKILERRDAS